MVHLTPFLSALSEVRCWCWRVCCEPLHDKGRRGLAGTLNVPSQGERIGRNQISPSHRDHLFIIYHTSRTPLRLPLPLSLLVLSPAPWPPSSSAYHSPSSVGRSAASFCDDADVCRDLALAASLTFWRSSALLAAYPGSSSLQTKRKISLAVCRL